MAIAQPIIGIPIKPFGIAKQRLHPRLDTEQRATLGKAIGARTIGVAQRAAHTCVITADSGVSAWAYRLGAEVIAESPSAGGLDSAAAALRDHALAAGRPWIVLHADLPAVTAGDIFALTRALAAGQSVIAPSHDGGTSAFGSTSWLRFAYGPGSFHRHLRSEPGAVVVVRPGLALDLDTVADIEEALTLPAGRWLAQAIAAIDSAP